MIAHRRNVLQEGRFGWCGRSGMALTQGAFWPRRSGGYNFYLGASGLVGVDFNHPIAACGPAATTVRLDDRFESSRDAWLAVRTISRFGLESEGFAWIRVRADEMGDGSVVPDPVINLRAGRTAWGTLKLQWEYQPRMGIVRPAAFEIYIGPGDGPIDYDHPLARAVYREGLRSYAWDSPDFLAAYPVRAVVRALTADGADDGSKLAVVTLTDLQYPGSAEDLAVEQT